jgi:hypothetical protein
MYEPPEAYLGYSFLSTSRYDVTNWRKREKEVVVGQGWKRGEGVVVVELSL